MGPSTDDPRKLLYAAARWMTSLGWTFVTVGFVFLFLGLLREPRIAVTGACSVAGGVLFLLASAFARRHRRWAVWLGIWTAGLAGVALALLLTCLVLLVGWHDLAGMQSVPAAAAVALLLVAVAVHALVVWALSNAFAALDEPRATGSRVGFEPVLPAMPRAVLPVDADEVGPTGN
jgi:hypothetical protein